MITEGALVIYKNKPALVKEKTDGKFTILPADGEQVKVRDKDIQLLHSGPVKNFDFINFKSDIKKVKEAWELLSAETIDSMSLKDASSFIYNEYTPSSAYAVYCLLNDGFYFYGTADAVKPRSAQEAEAEETKRSEKSRETDERYGFLERVKAQMKNPAQKILLPQDAKYFQDVEALAYGKSAKSRTMKDLKLSETPQDAHALLLKTGFWSKMVNPHPFRFGLSLSSAGCQTVAHEAASHEAASKEEQGLAEVRRDLCHLASFAIDSPWSSDPDDAVSIEKADNGNTVLYVHIADPASLIAFDSPEEKEARDRGVTLYLPETTVRMLAEDFIPVFALGLGEKSKALTFKMTINENAEIIDTQIFASVVKVKRVTYEEADEAINGAQAQSGAGFALCELFNLSQKLFKRRAANGAVNIIYTDVHITVKGGTVCVEPVADCKSVSLVRECMIAANEGAGNWAASRGLSFPYISQEVELDCQIFVKTGIAGSLQLRRCMRPRALSVKPGRHQGLGLDIYTQVTSPLRRYTDLLAHIQIRSLLRGGKTLSADVISNRLGYSEAAASAAVHAERASVNHWLMVYLSDKKDAVFDAVAVENKGGRWALLIPSLALETQVSLNKNVSPNDTVKLVLKSVNIAKAEAVFAQNA